MSRRLPSFSAMRAFEAAARLGSFKEAADELLLSPSAISHQVKALEAYLGMRLFVRSGKLPRLTEAGRAYMKGLGEAFDRIDLATDEVMRRGRQGQLTIWLYPTLASLWLIPRLGRFQQAQPQLGVRLMTSFEALDFDHTELDLAIRYGEGDWPGLRADYLFGEEMAPVCSPALAAEFGPIREPLQLAEQILICCPMHPEEWEQWFASLGLTIQPGTRRLHVDSRELALKAAASGLGLAMGRSPYIEEVIAEGRLIMPLHHRLDTGQGYFLACPELTADQPKIVSFRDLAAGGGRESPSAVGSTRRP